MTEPTVTPVLADTTMSKTVRRGFLAAAWAAVAAMVLRESTQPVEAGTDGDVVPGTVTSAATQTTVRMNAPYSTGGAALTGLRHTTTTGITYSYGSGVVGYSGSSNLPVGVLGAADSSTSGTGVLGFGCLDGPGVFGITYTGPGVLGQSSFGVGVLGQSPSFGVRGELTGSANGYAMFAVNGSSYQGPYPGTGGWALYAASQWGHALVGASLTPGAAGFVGSNNSVAGAYAGLFYGPVVVTGDFTVTGAKSAAVAHPDGSHRRVYCTESPESWFEDFGKGQLACGEAAVTIDPDFAAIAHLDDYHVFLTAYDANHLLHVAEQTAAGFTVRAQNDTATGRFSWRLVAKRKDIPAPRFDPVDIPNAPEMPPIALSPTPSRPNVPIRDQHGPRSDASM
jgi:hypothetical protein